MYIIYQIFNVDELSKLWYSENRNKYSKKYQILCGISALMMYTKKKKLEEELEHIPLEEERRIKEGELDRTNIKVYRFNWRKNWKIKK